MSTAMNIIDEIKELLSEKEWTRQSIANYTKKDFIKLDDIIEKSFSEEYSNDLKDECLAHLKTSPKSIIALYIAGIVSLEENSYDDTYIFQVIKLFQDNSKYNLVEFLAERVLEYGENKLALEVLEDCYQSQDNNEELIKVWERIVRIDHENGQIPKKLAEIAENEERIDDAIFYYKKALRRYAVKGNIQQTETLWQKLADLISEDMEFFNSVEKDLAKKNTRKTAELLSYLIEQYLEQENVERAITLLKRVIEYLSKNVPQKDLQTDIQYKSARAKLVESFRIKYKNHSQLEECIKNSKINQNWMRFKEALADFEKHIAFDVGNWVYHKSWKIGKITKIDEENFTINFENKRDDEHKMTLQMALKSLEVLTDNHLWIIKKFTPEKLKENNEEGIKFVLETLFRSFGNKASLKEIKREITSGIVPVKDWNKWWTKAKKIIKKEPTFGSSYEKKDDYFLRDKLLSFEEESFLKFSAKKAFQERFDIMEDYLKHSEDFENDNFIKMLQYFTDIANNEEHITEKTVQGYLLIKKIQKMKVPVNIVLKPENIVAGISNYTRVFEDLPDTETKKELIELIRKNKRLDWDKIISEFMKTKPTKAHNHIADELFGHDKIEELKNIINYITNNYRNNPELFVWACKYMYNDEDVFKALIEDESGIIFNLIQLVDTLGRDIENKKEVTLNRRIYSQINDVLFTNGNLRKYFENIEGEVLRKTLLMIKGSVYLDDKTKFEALEPFKETHPEIFEIRETEEVLHDFMVTRNSFNEKHKQWKHILNVEIPKNSKEIGEAQEKGDLRENAEYQSALEKQKNLQSMASKLDADLKKAKIIDFNHVDITKISVGTHVQMLNLDTNENEEYIILGEWDSNPEENIVSYKSPFGASILGFKESEEFEVNVKETVKRYKVLSIKAADVES